MSSRRVIKEESSSESERGQSRSRTASDRSRSPSPDSRSRSATRSRSGSETGSMPTMETNTDNRSRDSQSRATGTRSYPTGSDDESRSRSASPDSRSRSNRSRSPEGRSQSTRSRSPEGRSRSTRSRSPEGRSRSTRSRSPTDSRSRSTRSRSPEGRSRSTRSRSPDGRSESPEGRSRSPEGRSRSPEGRSRSTRSRSPTDSRSRSTRSRSPEGRSRSTRSRSPSGSESEQTRPTASGGRTSSYITPSSRSQYTNTETRSRSTRSDRSPERSESETHTGSEESSRRRTESMTETRSVSEGSRSSDSRDVRSGEPRSTGSFTESETGSRRSGTSALTEEERSSILDDYTNTESHTSSQLGRSGNSRTSTSRSATSASRTSTNRPSSSERSGRGSRSGPRSSSRRTDGSSRSSSRRHPRDEELDEETGESGEEEEEEEEEIEDFRTPSEEEEALLPRNARGSRGGRGGSARNSASVGRSAGSARESGSGRGSGAFGVSNRGSTSLGTVGLDPDGGDFDNFDLPENAPITLEDRNYFLSLPVGPSLVTPLHSDETFLEGYNNTVVRVTEYIQSNIQMQEVEILAKLGSALGEAVNPKPAEGNAEANKPSPEEVIQDEFRKLLKVRKTRHHFRGILFDAMNQRRGLLEAYEWRKIYERAKEERDVSIKRGLDWVFFFFLLFQALILISYTIIAEFPDFREITDQNTGKTSADGRQFYLSEYYFTWTGMLFIAFLGLGYSAAYTQRASYSAIALAVFTAAVGFEWGLLNVYFFHYIQTGRDERIKLTMLDLVDGAHAAIAHAISFLIVVGTVNTAQLSIMLFIEGIFYGFNYWIGWTLLKGYDGGVLYVHIFGAFFGLGVALKNFLLKPRRKDFDPYSVIDSRYVADLFANAGTLFCWIFWPCFNAVSSPQGTQFQVLFNTVLGMMASVSLGMGLSRLFHKNLFHIAEIRPTAISGAIILGTIGALLIDGWVASVMGYAAALATFIGVIFNYFTGQKSGMQDPSGTFWSSGIIGWLAVVAGFLAILIRQNDLIWGIPFDQIFWKQHDNQDTRQLIVMAISTGVGFGGGALTSIVLLLLHKWVSSEDPNYNDNRDFKTPMDFPDSFMKRDQS